MLHMQPCKVFCLLPMLIKHIQKVAAGKSHCPKEEQVPDDQHQPISQVKVAGGEHHIAEVVKLGVISKSGGVFITLGRAVSQTGATHKEVEAPQGNHDGREIFQQALSPMQPPAREGDDEETLETAQQGGDADGHGSSYTINIKGNFAPQVVEHVLGPKCFEREGNPLAQDHQEVGKGEFAQDDFRERDFPVAR